MRCAGIDHLGAQIEGGAVEGAEAAGGELAAGAEAAQVLPRSCAHSTALHKLNITPELAHRKRLATSTVSMGIK